MQKTITISSGLILIFAGVASFLGILNSDLYHDNSFVKTVWQANDWITFLFVIPSLLIVMLLSKKMKAKAVLVWLGLLSYFFYNYAFYLFGAVFNSMFLLYVFICALSFYSMLGICSTLPVHEFNFEPRTTKWVSIFLIMLCIMLCLIEIPPCINFIVKGEIPQLNLITGHPTNIVYALDLTFIVPAMLIAAILNFKKNVWGGIFSLIMLVKASTYGLVLISGTISLMLKGDSDPLFPVWIFITSGGIIGVILMLRSLTTDSVARE